MTNVIQFPDQRARADIERSKDAEMAMEQLIGDFDEQFQIVMQSLMDSCDLYPDEWLLDPISWGNGYLQIAIGAGIEPDNLIGFQQIQAICEEFGFIYTKEHLPDGTVCYEFLPDAEGNHE